MNRIRALATIAIGAGLLHVPVTGAAETPYVSLLERYDETIVPVEAVLQTQVKMGGQGEEQESRLDIVGALVSPRGLVMIWNSHISSQRVSEIMERMGREGIEVEITPTEFTVSLQEPRREADAFLAATDSTLDLAFLQLSEPPAEPLPYVDFETAAETGIGETVYTIDRMTPSFDDAPRVTRAVVGGRLTKPRQAWILDADRNAFGLPVFAADGTPVGALTTIFSTLGDQRAGGGLGQFMGSLMRQRPDVPVGAFVLPGDRVRHLVRRAGKRADELLAQRIRERDSEAADADASELENEDGR